MLSSRCVVVRSASMLYPVMPCPIVVRVMGIAVAVRMLTVMRSKMVTAVRTATMVTMRMVVMPMRCIVMRVMGVPSMVNVSRVMKNVPWTVGKRLITRDYWRVMSLGVSSMWHMKVES